MRQRFVLPILMGCLLWAAPAAATTYKVDEDHTSVSFKVSHLGFSMVLGTFNQFDGSFEYIAGESEKWWARATVQTASIDTANEDRDAHLRSPDFFDADKYPTITFTSTKVMDASGNKAKLHGTLTLHGIEQPVVWDLSFHGEGKDPWGNQRSGFSATTTINRKDFGITWNKVLDAGSLMVGEEVEITLEVEGIAQ